MADTQQYEFTTDERRIRAQTLCKLISKRAWECAYRFLPLTPLGVAVPEVMALRKLADDLGRLAVALEESRVEGRRVPPFPAEKPQPGSDGNGDQG